MEQTDAHDAQFDTEPEEVPALPAFSLAMIIIDLVFCGLRVPMVLLSIIGLSSMGSSHPLASTAIFEVLTGVALALLGISAAVLLLLRKRFGLHLGTLALMAVTANLAVAIVQLSIQFKGVPRGMRMGMLVGAGVMMALRLTENVLYAAALVLAARSGALE